MKSAIPRPLMAEHRSEIEAMLLHRDSETERAPAEVASLDSTDTCPSQETDAASESKPVVYEGPPPPWLVRFKEWLPTFLAGVSERLKDGEYYPLSSLKGDFRATCGLEMDHASIGYPKLSDFVRSLGHVRMKVTPVGYGPATHMVLLPQGRSSFYSSNWFLSRPGFVVEVLCMYWYKLLIVSSGFECSLQRI